MFTASRLKLCVLLAAAAIAGALTVRAETGSDAWLRFVPIGTPAQRDEYRRAISAIVGPSTSPTGDVIAAELTRGLSGLLGTNVPRVPRPQRAAVLVGTADTPLIASL